MPPQKLDRLNSEPPRPVLPLVGQLVLSVPVTTGMSPSPRLVVFYRRPDGETVADSVAFDVKPCFANNVSFSFRSSQLVPGAQVGADGDIFCLMGTFLVLFFFSSS